jgi:hypothetical protein
MVGALAFLNYPVDLGWQPALLINLAELSGAH